MDMLPSIAIELMAELLHELREFVPFGQAKYEYRHYAALLIERMDRAGLDISIRPKIVALPRKLLRSTRPLREAAERGWVVQLREKGDPICAFEAALRVTMAMKPDWSLRDACVHTIRFVVTGQV